MPTNEVLYRVEAKDFVAGAVVANDRIIRTAPRIKVFIGQPISNLQRWAIKNGMRIERL